MAEQTKSFIVPSINDKRILVEIIGKTPLICHQFDEKSKRMILDIQQKTAKGPRQIRTTELIRSEYERSVYRTTSGFIGFPARNLKNSMVRAGKNVGLAMTDIKTLFFILPDEDDLIFLRVKGKKLKNMDGTRMREDRVRVGNGSTDLRYRAELPEWGMSIQIEYDADSLRPESLLNLVRRAGRGGLGEWRPTAPKNPGDFGRFDIVMEK